MSVLGKESNQAGVTVIASNPFSSMEINDQKGGVNGIATDSKMSGSVIRITRKANNRAGVVGTPFDYLPSLSFGRAGL